jgi:hypothetical protein
MNVMNNNNFPFHPASIGLNSSAANPSAMPPSNKDNQPPKPPDHTTAMESLDKSFSKCNLTYNKPNIQLPESERNMSWAAVVAIVQATSKLGPRADLAAFANSDEYKAMIKLKDKPRPPTGAKSIDATTKADNVPSSAHVPPQHMQMDRRHFCKPGSIGLKSVGTEAQAAKPSSSAYYPPPPKFDIQQLQSDRRRICSEM